MFEATFCLHLQGRRVSLAKQSGSLQICRRLENIVHTEGYEVAEILGGMTLAPQQCWQYVLSNR